MTFLEPSRKKVAVQLNITQRAAKQLKAMPKADGKRMLEAFGQIAAAYPERVGFATELVGSPNRWRARKGDWRAVYEIKGDELIVLEVVKRSEAYR